VLRPGSVTSFREIAVQHGHVSSDETLDNSYGTTPTPICQYSGLQIPENVAPVEG